LDVPIPNKCSYAWKSILQSRKVIQKGAIWRVGDGRSISIWDQSWLPKPGMSKVVSPKLEVGLNRVCDLFYPGTKSWNVEVLQNYFYPWEVDAIRKIYVSEACNLDCLVWPKTSDGSYSVKSAYQMLATEAINEAPSLSGGTDTKVWKTIWKIRVPPKIRHFMWRLAIDSLPTKQNIARRQIPIDETCSLCDDQKETSMHVIWLCDQAKAVWKSVPSFSHLYQVGYRSSVDLIEAVLDQGSAFTIALFSTIAWSIWQRRNKIRVQQPSWPLHEISKKARELVVEFFNVLQQPTRPEVQRHLIKWTKPPKDCYKANFHAALFENNNTAGIGVVIRDCNGNVMGALSQKIVLPQSIEHAEALAASRAVTFARELSLSKVMFEGDYLRIINAINKKEPCHTLFGHIIEEIWSSTTSLVTCNFQHVRREGNKLAHALARRAVVSADIDVWVEELPSDLDDVFNLDLV